MEHSCYYGSYFAFYRRHLYSDSDSSQYLYCYCEHCCDCQCKTYGCDHSYRVDHILYGWQRDTDRIRRWYLRLEHSCYYCGYFAFYSRHLYSDRDSGQYLHCYSEHYRDSECAAYRCDHSYRIDYYVCGR